MDWTGSKCAGPHCSFACFEPEFDHSRDASITSHPEARGGTRWVHLRYGPATRSPSFSAGIVNRLQDSQFPSFLLFKLRGFELLPLWDYPPLFMPAFAGRTLVVPNRTTIRTREAVHIIGDLQRVGQMRTEYGNLKLSAGWYVSGGLSRED